MRDGVRIGYEAGMEMAAKIVASFDHHGPLPVMLAATIRAAIQDTTIIEELQRNEGKRL